MRTPDMERLPDHHVIHQKVRADMLSSEQRKARFDWVKRDDGSSEFQDFLDGISSKARAKLLARIAAIEEYGVTFAATMLWVKKLEHNLYEIRVEYTGNQYRSLYFQVQGNHYMITHGFSKKTQKTPEQEKIHARHIRDRWIGGHDDRD